MCFVAQMRSDKCVCDCRSSDIAPLKYSALFVFLSTQNRCVMKTKQMEALYGLESWKLKAEKASMYFTVYARVEYSLGVHSA
jgi:hypothetical protein